MSECLPVNPVTRWFNSWGVQVLYNTSNQVLFLEAKNNMLKFVYTLTLTMLNWNISYFVNIVDPDQLASGWLLSDIFSTSANKRKLIGEKTGRSVLHKAFQYFKD